MNSIIDKPGYRSFVLPRHPDDDHIPDSIVNIYLSPGRIVTIQGPMFSKSMAILERLLRIGRIA
jgi:hypothetical protein